MLLNRVINRLLQPYWRMTRGLTLGVQAVVIGSSDSVLLVRHGYRPGWHFPGGGVEWNETFRAALDRELLEETGVIAGSPVELHGIFSNAEKFPGDHVAVFTIRNWEQPAIPPKNAEIVEQDFFSIQDLPAETVSGTRNRIAEIFAGQPVSEMW